MEPSDRGATAAAIWKAGSARWPAMRLGVDDVAAHLQRCSPLPRDIAHLEDFFLACACLAEDARALAELDRLLLEHVGGFVGRIDNGSTFADEVRQRVRERLLLAEPPRLASYAGSGPLLGWIRMVAVRLAIDVKRERTGEPLTIDAALGEQIVRRALSPESELIKARFRDEVARATAAGLRGLTSRQRAILRLYYLSELNIDEIGKMYTVHRATVARWICAAEKTVLESVRAHMNEQLGLSPSDIDNVAEMIRSELDVSIGRLLESARHQP